MEEEQKRRGFVPGFGGTVKKLINFAVLSLLLAVPEAVLAQAGADLQGYSISTPRPINPAASTTNPSALATQGQNPYLGSTPSGKATDDVVPLTLHEAVERGLRYNLGLIESNQANAEARAQRLRALSALLPDVSVKGEQAFGKVSFQEVGLSKLPPIPGVGPLPSTSGLVTQKCVEDPEFRCAYASRAEVVRRDRDAGKPAGTCWVECSMTHESGRGTRP
jgi:hypothetical protein